jgi:hypothetical protein
MNFVSCCYVEAIETHLARLSIVFLQSLYVTTFASHRQTFASHRQTFASHRQTFASHRQTFASHRQTFPNPKSAVLAM